VPVKTVCIIVQKKGVDRISNNKHFFQTTKGMPWAMEMGSEWMHPKEFRDITHAYPKFPSFVRSDGAENPSWYKNENAVQNILFKD